MWGKERASGSAIIVVIVGLLLVGTSLAGCGSPASTSQSTASTAEVATTTSTASTTTQGVTDPIVVGFAICQTGYGAIFDLPVAQMAELAVADINARGGVSGRLIETLYADAKTDPAQSAVAAMELLDKGVDVLIVTGNAEIGGPAARMANDRGVLCFGPGYGPGSNEPSLAAQGVGPLVYNDVTLMESEAAIHAEFALKEGWKTAYVLEDTAIAGTGVLARGFAEAFKAGGGAIVGNDTFGNADTSISSQVSKMAALSPAPDVIYLATFPPGGAMAVRQIRAAGIDSPLLSNNAFDGESWYDAVPDLVDFYYTAYVSEFGDDPNPDVNEIIKRYREKYPEPLTSGVAILGYDVMVALERAIERAGTTDGKALAAELNKFKDEQLLVGAVTYTDDVHVQAWRPMKIMALNRGTHTFIGEFIPSTLPAAIEALMPR